MRISKNSMTSTLSGRCLLLLVLVSMVLSREPRCKHPAHRRRLRQRPRSTTSTVATDEMDYGEDEADVYDYYAEYFRSKARLMAKLRERHYRGAGRLPASRSRPSGRDSHQLLPGEPLLPYFLLCRLTNSWLLLRSSTERIDDRQQCMPRSRLRTKQAVCTVSHSMRE